MSFLKCVRSVSCLNAALALLRSGYVHEVFGLCRLVDEANDDVTFISLRLGEGDEPRDDQKRLIREFFQEEFADEENVLDSQQKRDRVSRQRIRAAIASVDAGVGNPSDKIAIRRVLDQVYSGYIHGAYGHIMELFGGSPARYHTSGMLGTPKIAQCEEQLTNYVYRSVLAAEIVAGRSRNAEMVERLRTLRNEFAAKTGCVPDVRDTSKIMARIKGKESP